MKLQGKVALVTGAGRRLGQAIALALAREGADLVVHYRGSQQGAEYTAAEAKLLGRRAISVRADITSSAQVEAMVEAAVKEFGRIDILVNNAGIFTRAPLKDLTEEIWDQTLDVNLKGTFLCSREVSKVMLQQKGGKIINISSLGGVKAWPNYTHYCVSKAGVIMLTKCLALALAPHVQVNSIAPGIGIFPQDYSDQQKGRLLERIPLRRLGSPEEVTQLVVYLAARADFVTGQTFVIDGGRSIAI